MLWERKDWAVVLPYRYLTHKEILWLGNSLFLTHEGLYPFGSILLQWFGLNYRAVYDPSMGTCLSLWIQTTNFAALLSLRLMCWLLWLFQYHAHHELNHVSSPPGSSSKTSKSPPRDDATSPVCCPPPPPSFPYVCCLSPLLLGLLLLLLCWCFCTLILLHEWGQGKVTAGKCWVVGTLEALGTGQSNYRHILGCWYIKGPSQQAGLLKP